MKKISTLNKSFHNVQNHHAYSAWYYGSMYSSMNRFCCCWVGLIDIRVLTVINTGSIDMETAVDSTYSYDKRSSRGSYNCMMYPILSYCANWKLGLDSIISLYQWLTMENNELMIHVWWWWWWYDRTVVCTQLL